MTSRLRVNGRPDAGPAANDRGLCYGDGLFETIWWHHGRAPLWERHMARLEEGCRRLRLPVPAPGYLLDEVQKTAEGLETAVLRVTWTRGPGPRGYVVRGQLQPTCIVSAASAPQPPADWYHHGIGLRLCRTRLAVQPALAGLKHLNRLEQVLARNEWHDDSVDEGLMLDLEDRVIGATAANLFAVSDGHVYTPSVQRCGVAGTARAEVLARRSDARVTDLTLDDVLHADEVFLTSAVRGIVPVHRFDGHVWSLGRHTRRLQREWHAAGLPPQVAA